MTWSVVALLAGTTVGYLTKDQLLDVLVSPLGETIYYTSPGGGFSLMIQLCPGFGVIVAVPVLIFHLIQFLAPVLPGYSIKFLLIVLVSSCVVVALGVAFAYYVNLPAALYFLSEFSNDQVQSLITTDTYMSFVTLYLAGFAALFQLSLLLFIINGVTPLKPRKLLAGTRWVVLGSFVAAALITPIPDPFNQTIMAGPVILLYLGSIVPIKLISRNRREPALSKSGSADDSANTGTGTRIRMDISQMRLTKREKRSFRQMDGELCYWRHTDNRSQDTIVTFYYDGKYRFVKRYTPEESGVIA